MKIIKAKDYMDMSRKAANIISAQAVSYTHLDVYKRQAEGGRCSFGLKRRCLKGA